MCKGEVCIRQEENEEEAIGFVFKIIFYRAWINCSKFQIMHHRNYAINEIKREHTQKKRKNEKKIL